MSQITAKELGGISDLLSMEQNLVSKCRQYAMETTDTVLKEKYEEIASTHQHHFDELMANLK